MMKNGINIFKRLSSKRLYSSSNGPSSQSSSLYLEPSKWTGMETKQLLQLHNERKARLGSLYKPCEEEFKALLPTAGEVGVPSDIFKKYYYMSTEEMEKELDVVKGLDQNVGLDQYKFDDLPSQAQLLVHQHREQRFYNRLAAYELPLLTQYRQPYSRPSSNTHPVTYRYTSYLGESHPNARKVVLSVKTADLGLDAKQLHKLRLLAKTRYDHQTDILKMSSDRFEEPAQNARYLNTVLQKLLKEAKDLSDDFSDLALDKRHTIAKNMRKKNHQYEFPEEWKRPQDAPKKTVDVIDLLHENL